jgi:DNA-directed RNA polymerase subunit M/transcription elongation factor TFIIS
MKETDFCPTCRYYLYLEQDSKTLRRVCRNCGFQEEDKKGGLILEIDLKEKTSEDTRS